MQTDCVILGGGAGGLCAAAALGRRGLRVTVVERLPRVGKKLLATGNGRCNLSNLDMQPSHYGKAAPFVERVYAAVPPEEVAAFFASLGLMTAVEDGRVYPRTMAASAVLDVLRMACERYAVSMLTDTEVVALSPSRRGGWSVQLADGSGLFSPHVVAAMGGSAAPSMGTDGTGARLMQALSHEITPLYPALVQLRCSHPALKGLKGIRTQAELTLMIDGRAVLRETGELLLTDYGVSGVCVFQLSREAAPALAQGRSVRLAVNFLPEIASAVAGCAHPSARARVPVGADDRRFAAPAGADGHSGSASFAGYARRSPFGIRKAGALRRAFRVSAGRHGHAGLCQCAGHARRRFPRGRRSLNHGFPPV